MITSITYKGALSCYDVTVTREDVTPTAIFLRSLRVEYWSRLVDDCAIGDPCKAAFTHFLNKELRTTKVCEWARNILKI